MRLMTVAMIRPGPPGKTCRRVTMQPPEIAEPHDDTALPPAEPTAAEVAAALARLAAGVDQLMALVFRSTRW